MKKLVSIALITLFVASMIFMAQPLTNATTQESVDKGIFKDVDKVKVAPDTEPPEPTGHHSYWNVGDQAYWMGYDGFEGGVFTSRYTLKHIGSSVEIWVQNNINWGNPDPWLGYFPYPPEWRSNPPYGPTDEQIAYLANEFDTKILPAEDAFFGPPVFHDGSNAQLQYLSGSIPDDPEYYYEPSGRAVILVCNIRDENYYYPNYGGPGIAYPYKIIGVHIGDYEDLYFDRNVVTIDAISWRFQLGPPGQVWTGPWGTATVTAPYAYESTVAHEWQHLLHHELCPGDVTFMNEGCSMYAEFLSGYGIDPDYPNSYFYTPDNSLTEWGDQGDINILADYGAAALWTMYLSDQFGAGFLQYYFNSGGGGIDGINAALAHFKYKDRFDDVYRDWKLANLIRADFPGCHKYNYKSLNLNDPAYIPVRQYEKTGVPVPETKGTDFGNTITILGYDTEVSMVANYGSDYIKFKDWSRPGFIYFDGDDTATVPLPTLWTLTADGWYSGTGVNSADEFLAGDTYVDPASATMTLVTAYAFEEYWDFGFVQVSTDGGNTWTSLENEYTTFDHASAARPSIVANLPGLTGFSPDLPDWTTMTFDLSAYAGQTVKIGFHYMTDDLYTEAGWLINSVTVSGTEVSLAPFAFFPKMDFQVTIVSALVICGKTLYIPWDMWLTKDTNKGMGLGFAKKPSYVVLVVTPIMQKGMGDYKFQVTTKPIFKFC